MKNLFKKIILTCAVLFKTYTVISQTTCGTAQVISSVFLKDTTKAYTNTVKWYQLTLSEGDYNFTLLNYMKSQSTGIANKVEVYSGSCASLSSIGSDTLDPYNDSLINIPFTLTSSQTIYFKISSSVGTSNYVLSWGTVLIYGNSFYCPGQSITLMASALNTGTAVVTYTWSANAGSATTNTVVVTPTTTTVYTVTASSTSFTGTAVETITMTPLPTALCSCSNNNVVINGDLDSYSYCPWTWSQMDAGYPFWCNGGSSDYFNSCSGTIATVPSNQMGTQGNHTTGTNTGGYAGFIAGSTTLPTTAWEYVTQQLKCPLMAGQAYNISFWARGGSHCQILSTLGMALTQNTFIANPFALPQSVTPQVTTTTSVASNTWTQIQKLGFIANNEKFITIGNFNDVANSGFVSNPNATSPYILNAYNFIDDISITPATPTLTASTNTVNCSSPTTITLTATGAASAYTTWTGGFGSPFTGSVVTIQTPTATTTYTCSVNLPCSNCTPVTQTITVTGNGPPTISVTATPSFTICSGTSTTLTATGASSYTWSPSTALSCTACASPVANPTSTKTYTITASTGSCTGTKTVTVTVRPVPSVSVTGPTSTCAGVSTQLTASGAFSYAWTPTVSISCTGLCDVATATPTVNTTYTVIGTNLWNCSSTSTVAVTMMTNSCSTGTQPGSYTISATGTLSASPALIANDLYINGGNYTISAAETRIAASKTITVANGATLTVNNSWLHACDPCGGTMWQGIVVKNGGVLTVNNSIIEDAVQAVYTATNSATTPISNYTLTNSIFNNNATGVYIDTHPGDLSPNTIYNTVFTCRHLSDHTTANISTMKSDIAAATPLILSASNPTDLTIAGSRSSKGIYINAVSSYTTPVKVGANSGSYGSNIFDNLDYGIYTNQSSLTAINNVFQNITGNSYVPTSPIGVGILCTNAKTCTGNAASVAAILTVGNSGTTIVAGESNTFTNCLVGVGTGKTRHAFINNNIFDNETTATTFTTNGSYVTGQYAVAHSNFAFTSCGSEVEELQFANNTVQNYAYGHYMTFNKLLNTASHGLYITTNTITATDPNYCNVGIYLSQTGIAGVAGAGAGVPQDALNITANTITGVNTNCISVNSVNTSTATTGFVTINSNTELSMPYVSTATVLTTPPMAAVYITASKLIKVSNNSNIKCTGVASYPSSNSQFIHGIYVSGSPYSRITCNTVNYMGEDFVWEGTNSTSIWWENTMGNSRYGLVLRSTGIMGDQLGGHGRPIYDVWGNSDITSAQTLCDASDPGNTGFTSKLNCRAVCTSTTATTALPCVNTATATGTAYAYNVTTFTVVDTGSPGLCTSEGGNGRMAAGTTVQDTITTVQDSLLLEMQYGIEHSGPLPVYDTETRWATQYYISSTNANINAAPGYDNAKAFALIDGAMAGQDYNTAQNLLNGINSANLIEDNWKTVAAIQISQGLNQTDTLLPADVSALQNVAAQCHLSGGNIVWRARALLNNYFGGIQNYPDVCPVNNGVGGGERAQVTSVHSSENKYTVNLYPNPNNGQMRIDYSISENVDLQILDINGNLVCEYNLKADANSTSINNDKLNNGVYFYRIVKNNLPGKCQKLIIIK